MQISASTPPHGDRYGRLLRRLEDTEVWDGAIAGVEPLAGRLVARERVRRVLHGDATGVPLHVILTDVPFGAWFMALYLDLVDEPASRRAATRLLGLGTLSVVPTALAGWAEWAAADRPAQRVGMTHAGLQAAAALVFAASWGARRHDRDRLGVLLARLGGGVAVTGAMLGGHIGSGRRATVHLSGHPTRHQAD